MHAVTLITKEGCSLCEKVAGVLRASPSRHNYELGLSHVGENPESERRYLLRIPVVLVDGAEVFEAKDMDVGGLWTARLEGILARLTGPS